MQLAELGQTRRPASTPCSTRRPTSGWSREGRRRLSHRATRAALFIHLYRDQPILHLPFRFLTLLVDVDELLATWRYRHALMVHRMIGTKIGTGGSSGHRYLLATVERNKVFTDLYDLSTFLISRSALPPLPAGDGAAARLPLPAGVSARPGVLTRTTSPASSPRTRAACTSRPTATTPGPT